MQSSGQRRGVGDFKYYVGLSSLTQIASRDDRVCVLNIMGGESSEVTPVSHAYSGGNVVFGTAPGKGGAVLETPIGNIPVYNSVREGLVAGHRFNCGVVCTGLAGQTVAVKFDVNMIRAGLNFKFDWGGPVVAKY